MARLVLRNTEVEGNGSCLKGALESGEMDETHTLVWTRDHAGSEIPEKPPTG